MNCPRSARTPCQSFQFFLVTKTALHLASEEKGGLEPEGVKMLPAAGTPCLSTNSRKADSIHCKLFRKWSTI
jgi:hypothetical protein